MRVDRYIRLAPSSRLRAGVARQPKRNSASCQGLASPRSDLGARSVQERPELLASSVGEAGLQCKGGCALHLEPKRCQGNWHEGWTLDVYSRSGWQGDFRYMPNRSHLGECVYRLKYKEDYDAAPSIVEAATGFLTAQWPITVDTIIPAPPSTPREQQPVALLAAWIAQQLGVRCEAAALVKLLGGGRHSTSTICRWTGVRSKRVLLLDDVYRTGFTAKTSTEALNRAGASCIYFLAITRCRDSK